MGIKPTWVIWAISFFVLALMVRLEGVYLKDHGDLQRPLLRFQNTLLSEVNQSRQIGTSFAKRGEVISGKTVLYQVTHRALKIPFLQAKVGIDEGDVIVFDQNVTFIDQSGMHYVTEYAKYSKASAFLDVPVSFVATMGNHVFWGEKMNYDAKKGLLRAYRTNASIDAQAQ